VFVLIDSPTSFQSFHHFLFRKSWIHTRIHFYLLSHGTSPSFKLLFAFIPMLIYFFLLQLGTAYHSAALTAAPAVMEEKELEETWEAGQQAIGSLGNYV